MSHPVPSHDHSNEYPVDGITHYPSKSHRNALYHMESAQSKGRIMHDKSFKEKVYRFANSQKKSGGPLHRVADRLTAKTEALKKLMK